MGDFMEMIGQGERTLTNRIVARAIDWMERGWLPDAAIRAGIRLLLRQRLRSLKRGAENNSLLANTDAFLKQAENEPLAVATDKANEQHYEVPSSFYELILGPRKKYSCCFFERDQDDLATAEERALTITCHRAGLDDGMDILELGCGWGSLTLWMLEHYPAARVVAVSNSHSQREYIHRQAQQRGVAERLTLITRDIRDFDIRQRFDRIVSVEMFEHVRNHRLLMERIANWLHPAGRLFVHMFCHRQYAYPFETNGAANWMGRHFFTGGMMPHHNMLRRYDQHLRQIQSWFWEGGHYEKTCRCWIANMERHRHRLIPLLESIYGKDLGARWFQRWKMFFWACAELFGFRGGREWFVGHYLFELAAAPATARFHLGSQSS